MFGLGAQELIIISVILIFVFGAAKLPQLGKGVGLATRNFQKAVAGRSDTGEAEMGSLGEGDP